MKNARKRFNVSTHLRKSLKKEWSKITLDRLCCVGSLVNLVFMSYEK